MFWNCKIYSARESRLLFLHLFKHWLFITNQNIFRELWKPYTWTLQICWALYHLYDSKVCFNCTWCFCHPFHFAGDSGCNWLVFKLDIDRNLLSAYICLQLSFGEIYISSCKLWYLKRTMSIDLQYLKDIITKIKEVNLSAFAYRLFHEDF